LQKWHCGGILITKGVGIEATAILARDFGHRLPFTIDAEEIAGFAKQLSVVAEGLVAAEHGVHAMHDITEGGLLGAVREICYASRVGAEIREADVAIPQLTKAICEHFELDPLKLLSSGSMLIVAPEGQALIKKLQAIAIPAFAVGKVTAGDHPVLIRTTGERVPIVSHVEDELWRFFNMN
jgi:hydrogenase expression/formation protein HypE